jgi:D-alanine-D-alanine ligase
MSSAPLLVWVLAPFLETSDPNLDYYYDYSQGYAEYDRAFAALGIEWKWELVTLANYAATIERALADSAGRTPVIMNLCDGDETNGVPGVNVIHLLKRLDACFTGADAPFYNLTTSKIVMKRAFDAAGVPTPSWEEIPAGPFGAADLLLRLGNPLIVKPAVSAGSMGITVKSVVHTADDLTREVTQLYDGYRGWNLTDGGVLAESFIAGREFTTFIVGSYNAPESRRVYPPVERVFHERLPATEQFLSFDRLWEIYERETPLGVDEYLWQYAAAPAELQQAICDVSWAAYAAVEGTGYGRVDLRFDPVTGRLFVLEVNAQCGLSEDENHTSIGAILRFAGGSYSTLVREILDDAIAASARGARRHIA